MPPPPSPTCYASPLESITVLQLKDTHGGDPTPVWLPSNITGWGLPLLAALADAVGVPAVAEVWIRYGDDGAEERLEGGGRAKWRVIKGLEPGDVVLLVGAAVPSSRLVVDTFSGGAGRASSGEAKALPAGEQRFKKLGHLIIKEPVPQLMQKVGAPSAALLNAHRAFDRGTDGVDMPTLCSFTALPPPPTPPGI